LALKNPRYALSTLYGELTFSDERFLARMCGVSPRAIPGFLDEPSNTPEFAAHIANVAEEFRALSSVSADLYAKKVLNQYAAIRARKPSCVVETGMANGVSSSYFLLALRKNGKGKLHSIDLADSAVLPKDEGPGWLVPEWLRSPWTIYLEDSRELLPKVLAQVGQLPIFIHDSLHTYEHMIWEYREAYPYFTVRKPAFLR
jgi:methyltransferase family protein